MTGRGRGDPVARAHRLAPQDEPRTFGISISLTTSAGLALPQGTLRLVQKVPDGSGTYADYRQRDLAFPEWHRIDVRAHCHLHQVEWTDALTRWHDELMQVARAATPWAWLLPGSRIHVWQEPVRPFVFALGLLSHFREQPGGEVCAVGCPKDVGEYVGELSGGSIQVIDGRSDRWDARVALGKALRRVLKAASVLRKLRPVWRPPTLRTEVDLLVVSLGLSAGSILERGDHYFGRALDETNLRAHWLYQLDTPSELRGIEAALRASGRAFSFDHRLVSWGDVLRVLSIAVQVRRRLGAVSRSLPEIRIGDTASRLFPLRFFQDLFLQAGLLNELILHHAMSRLLRALSPHAVCYPYEEKGLDHALLMACASAPRSVRTIAFAHAAYTAGDLYLKESSSDGWRPPRPTLIAAAGRGLGPWLAAEFGRRDVVVNVGSPRWTPRKPGGEARRGGGPLRILFVTGFGYEATKLIEWVEQCPDLFEDCQVVIRPNWHSWHVEQRAAFGRLRGAHRITVGHDDSINEQIGATDVVLFVSTSAVAEAIWRGRAAVYVELNDLWVVEPQQGQAAVDAVPRCTTPDQLKETLRRIAAMNADEYQRLVAAQRVVAERIYMPFDRERFRELVTGDRVP